MQSLLPGLPAQEQEHLKISQELADENPVGIQVNQKTGKEDMSS